jgi:GT2 family glycosyltransferase
MWLIERSLAFARSCGWGILSEVPSARIQCVIVLYQCALGDSKTLQSLTSCCRQDSGLAYQLSTLVYDNSPSAQQFNVLDQGIRQAEYRHDASNGGLAAAYNYGLARAQKKEIDWLLLLDQDTVVVPELFSTLLRQISARVPADVCAMVPKLFHRGTVISPQIVGRLHNHPVAPTFAGVSLQTVTALNSGACLRVSAVLSVGAFPREYWLEYLDHIMFSRLQRAGGKVLVLDIAMRHQLSLENLEVEMSLARYKNVLAAEWRFVRETGWGSGALMHRLRLLKRALRYALKLRNKQYALQALHSALS